MRKLIEQVYGSMPREFASPQRRMVDSMDRLITVIDEHNGLTDCFVSAYSFASDECSYGDVTIDKAVFDFDDSWDHLIRTHEFLEKRDVAHFVTFSGSNESGHLYVLTKPTKHQQSLEYFQRNVVINQVGLRECKQCGNDVRIDSPDRVAKWYCRVCDANMTKSDTDLVVDSNLVGDPATMIRIPNTWHPRAERFCVPLRPEEIEWDLSDIYELAKSQRDLELGDIVCGSKTVEITQHKSKAEELYQSYDEQRRLAGFESDQQALDEFSAEIKPVEIMEDLECTCMRSMITDDQDRRTKPPLGHTDRRILITHLIECGYNPAEINKFIKFAIEEDKARHSVVEEEQAIRLWRDGVRAPNKMSLKEMGKFRQDCPIHASVSAEVEP